MVNGSTTAIVSSVVSADSGAGLLWDLTISGGNLASFNGTVGLNLSSSQNITDLAGNALPGTEPMTDQTYTLDNTAPTATSFTRQTPSPSLTNADILVFRVTFSEAVQNVTTADFSVNGTTTATVTNVATADAGAGLLWNVTVSGGDLATFEGTVGLNVSNSLDITDAVGNAFAGAEPATDETYSVVQIDTEVTLVGGVLKITDIESGDSNDSLTISYAGGNYTKLVLPRRL